MLKNYNNQKGFATVEYALLIAVVLVALFAIQGYVRKSTQSYVKQQSDSMGDQFDVDHTLQVKRSKVSYGTVETRDTTGQTATTYHKARISRSEEQRVVDDTESSGLPDVPVLRTTAPADL
jgi:Flp pilus assembly pilin Flp